MQHWMWLQRLSSAGESWVSCQHLRQLQLLLLQRHPQSLQASIWPHPVNQQRHLQPPPLVPLGLLPPPLLPPPLLPPPLLLLLVVRSLLAAWLLHLWLQLCRQPMQQGPLPPCLLMPLGWLVCLPPPIHTVLHMLHPQMPQLTACLCRRRLP
jgi:hypothetical protein